MKWLIKQLKVFAIVLLLVILILVLSFVLIKAQKAFAPIRLVHAEENKKENKVDFVTPELKAICACESVGDWSAEPIHIKNGKVLRGKVTPEDVGVCQINETYHLAASKRMGLNIYSWAGNVAYANYLYVTQGTKPWAASRKCWDKYVELR